MVTREAQLWKIRAQYFFRRGSIIPHQGVIFFQKGPVFSIRGYKLLPKYRQGLCSYSTCRQIDSQCLRNSWFISLLILTFLNRCISVKTSLINTNLGLLWITACYFWPCGSIFAYPIIYRLAPSPFRFEIRQWREFTKSYLVPRALRFSKPAGLAAGSWHKYGLQEVCSAVKSLVDTVCLFGSECF